MIAEYDNLGTLQASYIYGSGIDEVLMSIRYTPSAIRYFYYHDGLGSVTDIRTQSTGAIIEKYSYDVYGRATIKNSTGQIIPNSAIGNNRMFTGREWDGETGLYHYRNRAYSPQIGRFLQRDPVGYVAGINLYSYCDSVGKPTSVDSNLYQYAHNNPINFTDPYGLWYIDINIGLGFLIGFSGITGGIIISPQGIYKYTGFGLSIPGPSGSITFSPSNPTVGWNAAFQGSAIVAYQQGRDYKTLTDFRELGFGTPGLSFMNIYVDRPWTWPWRRGKDCN